jgi:periplasmic protein TonB
MLYDAGNAVTAECLTGPSPVLGGFSDRKPVPRLAVAEVQAMPPGSRYGQERRFNFSALGITILIHAVIGLGLLGLNYRDPQEEEVRLVSVNLSPPPPPAAQKKPSPPKEQRPPAPTRPPLMQLSIQPPRPVPPPVVDPQPAPAPPAADVTPPAPPASPAPPSIINSTNLGTRMLSGTAPRYPVESRRNKEQGTVELLIILGVDGAVESISVSRSSSYSRLDSAALNAVRRWRWSPTIRDGKPVRVRGVVEIPFVLKGVE